MADLGTAYVQIVPAATGISGKISSAIAPESKAAGISAGKNIASSMGSKLQSLGGSFMKAGAIATAVSVPIIAGIKKAMDAYQIQNAAETKLTEIYKTRMGASKGAAKATMELASALQKEGVVGDEVQLSGAQQLATFAKYPSTVNSLLPAMNNLLVQQKGLNGTTQDATNIANLMGKVMQGQTGALKRVGISFTDAEEKVLKYGTEEERAAMLSQVITNNVGNMNKVMAETPEGKIQQMKNSFEDLAEKIGATLAPALASVASWISTNIVPKVEAFISFLSANPIIAKIVVGITGLLAIGGPLLIMIGAVMSAVGGLLPVLAGLSAPMLAIPAIIAAVVAALIYAWNTSESFRTAVLKLISSIISAIKPIIPVIVSGVQQIIKALQQVLSIIVSALGPAIAAITPILTGVIKVMVNIASAVIPIVVKAFTLIATTVAKVIAAVLNIITNMANFLKSAFNAIKTAAQVIWNAIKTAITKPIESAKKLVSGIVDSIKSFLKFSGLSSAVSNVFSTIKGVITKPIEKAKDTIKGVVDKIKGFFNFKVSAPHIPIPHFSISPAGWTVGQLLKGKIPSLSVRWYANGAIFDNPALAGIGEAGPEAAVPLSGKRKMRPFAQAIAEEMGGAGTVYNIGDVTLDPKDLKDVLTLEGFVEVVKKAKGLR